METLLIGMLLAFILGATTSILPLWLSCPNLFKRTQIQAIPFASHTDVVHIDKDVPIVGTSKEKTTEEKKQEARLSELQNMWDYDGSKQEGEKVEKR